MRDDARKTEPGGRRESGAAARAPVVLVYLLLVAVAGAHFAAYYSLRGTIVGRDALGHVFAFFNSVLGDQRSENPLVQFLLGFDANYGPALRVLTLPFWLLLGSGPAAFGAVNLLVFGALAVLLGFALARQDEDPGWAFLPALLILASPVGTNVFLQYGIDALYILSCLWVYYAFVVRRSAWPVLAAVALAGLFVRLNTLFYLAGPLVVEAARWLRGRARRPLRGTRRATRARPVWWVAAGLLLALDAGFYLPQLSFVTGYLTTNPDFRLDNVDNVPGLLTLENWLWFPRHLRDWFSLWVLAALAMLAAWGWWRGMAGRRLASAVFILVPPFLYSFILGTRVIEYIGPSVVVGLVATTMGVARLPGRALRWPLVFLLLGVVSIQLWTSYGLPAVPGLREGSPADRALRALSADAVVRRADDGRFGDAALAGKFLRVAFPGEGPVRIGLASFRSFPQPRNAPILLAPFLDARGGRFDFQVVDRETPEAPPFDAFLVLDNRADRADPLPPALHRAYRPVLTTALTESFFIHFHLRRGDACSP